MKWNQLSGKAAEDRPWVNYLTDRPTVLSATRGENRTSRRQKDRDVRLELRRVNIALARLDKGTEEYAALDQRKSELELYEASPHRAINEPYVRETP